MVFPGSRPAVWTMALALSVCLGGSAVPGAQDKPAPASAQDSSAARTDKSANHAEASRKTGPTGQSGRQGREECCALDTIE